MAKSQYREADSILDAIKSGRFYSSAGPQIRSVERNGDALRVECSDAAEINFISRGWCGKHIKAPPGEPLNAAEFALGSADVYVRIEVIDSTGRGAWTNPLYL